MSTRTVELELATPGVDAQGRPTREPLTLGEEHMLVNMGPQHPATHGVLRLVVELDGETVVRCIPHLGYLHSGCEMSRIISHMVWLGTTSIDLGAFTPFLWAFQERERIYDLQEMWTGARLTT